MITTEKKSKHSTALYVDSVYSGLVSQYADSLPSDRAGKWCVAVYPIDGGVWNLTDIFDSEDDAINAGVAALEKRWTYAQWQKSVVPSKL